MCASVGSQHRLRCPSAAPLPPTEAPQWLQPASPHTHTHRGSGYQQTVEELSGSSESHFVSPLTVIASRSLARLMEEVNGQFIAHSVVTSFCYISLSRGALWLSDPALGHINQCWRV